MRAGKAQGVPPHLLHSEPFSVKLAPLSSLVMERDPGEQQRSVLYFAAAAIILAAVLALLLLG